MSNLQNTFYKAEVSQANRATEINHQLLNSTIEDLLYEYDPNGNRKSYTRNALQPLRTGVTGTSYDDANEMLSFTPAMGSSKNMTYDNNGNLLTVTNNCGITTYTWDVRNRLTGMSGYKADCTILTASFDYDAIGRRISKTINGTTTQYLYDSFDIIQELQGGTPTVNYVRSLKIDEPLTRIKADGTIRHYVADALGSIIALTDDSGVVQTTYTYDPFGNVTVSGETSDNPFQFVGKENDGTGLMHEGFRYYSYELQRYISQDPIGLAGGDVNFYARVGNNAVNYVDPLGLERVENGLIYSDSGQLIGEFPLEAPDPFMDPIDWVAGVGGFLNRSRVLFPRCEGTGNSDVIIKWFKGYKTRFDISGHPHRTKPHIHWWTKR